MPKPTVCVAGATGSIGLAAVRALNERGARVVLLGRDADRLTAAVARVEASASRRDPRDGDIETLVIDFSDMASVERAAAEALSRFPKIDGLVLSVGALLQGGPRVLPSGHEAMFATNVLGPFKFTEMLMGRLEESAAIVVHVIALFQKAIDWDDLESIKNHKTMVAFNRTKTCNRLIAGEMARRYEGKIASVAFDPTYVIDKDDPDLAKRWPKGPTGLFWRIMTVLFAKPTRVAGVPIASLVLDEGGRAAMNGALYRLSKRVAKPDPAMNDEELGARLWAELSAMV